MRAKPGEPLFALRSKDMEILTATIERERKAFDVAVWAAIGDYPPDAKGADKDSGRPKGEHARTRGYTVARIRIDEVGDKWPDLHGAF